MPAPRASASVSVVRSTGSTESNRTTPAAVRWVPPGRTRGASQRRNTAVTDPSRIPAAITGLSNIDGPPPASSRYPTDHRAEQLLADRRAQPGAGRVRPHPGSPGNRPSPAVRRRAPGRRPPCRRARRRPPGRSTTRARCRGARCGPAGPAGTARTARRWPADRPPARTRRPRERRCRRPSRCGSGSSRPAGCAGPRSPPGCRPAAPAAPDRRGPAPGRLSTVTVRSRSSRSVSTAASAGSTSSARSTTWCTDTPRAWVLASSSSEVSSRFARSVASSTISPIRRRSVGVGVRDRPW